MRGIDRHIGGPGKDTIRSYDGAPGDQVSCGSGKDTVTAFEEFEGSKFNDVMKGSNNRQYDENFRGLGGNDVIDDDAIG